MVAAKLRSGNIHLRRFRNDHWFMKLGREPALRAIRLCTLAAGIVQYFDLVTCICGFG
jgi:hypothetical protein